jgi:hypothetical protein
VTYDGDAIYYPHPTTFHLTKMQLSTRQTTTVLDKRVQFCTAFEHTIYFSNFDDERYLYQMTDGDITVVEKRAVASIKRTLQTLTVTFDEGESFVLTVDEETQAPVIDAHEVALAGFGSSWFGTYKGKAQPICFKGEDVSLLVLEGQKNMTVDILSHDTLAVTVTANKKRFVSETPMQLHIAKACLNPSLNYTHMQHTDHGASITVYFHEDFLLV